MTESRSGRQALRPRARLMTMLGLELISGEAVALSELVKNAYDADATTVLISVRDETSVRPAIVRVLDDGTGMSSNTVQSNWLEPATASRRMRKVSPGGRRSVGEKGIGRFAAARLAHGFSLTTRGVDEAAEVRLSLSWDDFLDESKYLDEIQISWREHSPEVFIEDGRASRVWRNALERLGDQADEPNTTWCHGTMLELAELRSPWTESLAEEVQRGLSRLVSPVVGDEMPLATGSDFRILLDLPSRLSGRGGWLGPPEELNRPHYRLHAKIDEVGEATIQLRLRGQGESQPVRTAHFTGPGGRAPSCGPFQLDVAVWDRDIDALGEVRSALTPQQFRRLLDTTAGVSVYRDGFRVLPYGETGDDWLGLDRRRINDPSRRLSNNQVLGTLVISRDTNPLLIDQTNREGLVNGPPMEDLRFLVRELLNVLEVERARAKPPPSRKRAKASPLDPPRLSAIRAAALERNDQALTDLVDDAEEELGEQISQAREVVARFQRLATLGQLVDQIVHEIAQSATGARQAAVAGLELVEDNPLGAARSLSAKNLIAELREEFQIIRDQMRAVADVLRRLGPFGGRRRGRPRTVVAEDAVRDVVRLLRTELEGRSIDLRLPEGKTEVTIDGTELQEILINLLTNAAYWVTRGKRGGVRRIAVEIERLGPNLVTIAVSDNGAGVPPDDQGRIFEPYYTTREGGMGLGLALAGQIAEDYYGGSLELVQPGTLGGATFVATFRRRV